MFIKRIKSTDPKLVNQHISLKNNGEKDLIINRVKRNT
jgi:hypothetical protein